MAKGQIKQKQATINQSTFEGLCAIQCTKEEIYNIFNVSDTTLTRWCEETYGENFEGVYKKFSSTGKMSLRRNMFRQAEKNPTMAIWLSKQHLGMRDSFPDEVNYTEVNKGIMNIANLLNNPVKNRTEKSIEEKDK